MTYLSVLASCAVGVTNCNDTSSNTGGLLIIGAVLLVSLLGLGLFFWRIRPGASRNRR